MPATFFLFSLQGWGRAAAATYLVGFVILVICFALAVIAFSIEILRFNFVRGIGGLLFVVGKAQRQGYFRCKTGISRKIC